MRRRRRRLLWWSLPAVLLALATAVKLASLSLTAQDAITASETARYEESIAASDALMTLNWFEPWIAYFDRGTAAARAQQYNDATDDLSVALELAPADRSCEVRVNLALAWEELGDVYAEAGYLTGADLIYDTALAVIRGGEEDGCFEGDESESDAPPEEQEGEDPSGGAGDQLEDARDRVEGKQDTLDDLAPAPGEGDAGQGGGDGSGGGDSPEDDVQDKNDAAEQERRDQDADQRGGGEYAEKPW